MRFRRSTMAVPQERGQSVSSQGSTSVASHLKSWASRSTSAGSASQVASKLPIQRKEGLGGDVLATGEGAAKGRLPKGLQDRLSAATGQDFSQTTVHKNSGLPMRLGALATAQGNQIHLGPGQEQLLSHEAWHLAQQAQGRVKANTTIARQPINNDRQLEAEADQFAAGKPVGIGPQSFSHNAAATTAPMQRVADETLKEEPTETSEGPTEEYLWHNDILLDTIFDDKETEGNERLNSLRQVLYLMRELELDGLLPDTAAPMAEGEFEGWIAEDKAAVTVEKGKLDASIHAKGETKGKNGVRLTAINVALSNARKDRITYLRSDPAAKKLAKLRADATAADALAADGVASAERNMAWVQHGKVDGAEKEQKIATWTKIKAAAIQKQEAATKVLTDSQAEYERTLEPYDKPIAALEAERLALRADNRRLSSEIIADTREKKKLETSLTSMEKAKDHNPGAVKKFKLDRLIRELKELNHIELLEKLEALFATDPEHVKYPDFLRYAVLHFSGMRYQGAHGSWHSPQKILWYLKQQEIAGADAEGAKMMEAEAAKLIADNDMELNGLKGIGSDRRVIETDLTKKLKGDDRTAYSHIQGLETILVGKYLLLKESGNDAAALERLRKEIAGVDAQIHEEEGVLTPKALAMVQAARIKRQAALQSVYAKVSQQRITQLQDKDVLASFEQMKDQGLIPQAVWQEILDLSQMRMATDNPNWEADLKSKKLADLTLADPEAQAKLDQWRQILNASGFYEAGTSWRAQHAASLSPSLVPWVVCDQLGSILQHVRGLKRDGGLRGNLHYYQKQYSVEGGGFFKHPTSAADFPPGASIYWLHWSDVPENEEYTKAVGQEKAAAGQEKALTEAVKKASEELAALRAKDTAARPQTKRIAAKEQSLAKLKEELEKAKEAASTATHTKKGIKRYLPEGAKLPDVSNMYDVRDLAQYGFSESRVAESGWEMRRQQQMIGKQTMETVMRVKPNVPENGASAGMPLDFTTAKNPLMVKQWLQWQHEATVAFSSSSGTITFDTSFEFDGRSYNGMGLRKRDTSKLIQDRMVFVGYSPEQATSVPVAPFLTNVTAGMTEKAKKLKQ